MHPELARNPKAAKVAACAIANAMGAEIVPSPDGKIKRVLINGRAIDCTTWLAAYSVVQRIRADQLAARGKANRIPVAQVWEGPLP